MPFGIKSASEEFQYRMCEIFGDLQYLELKSLQMIYLYLAMVKQ